MEALALGAIRGARGLSTMAGLESITGTAGARSPDRRPVVTGWVVAVVVVVAIVVAVAA